MESNQEDKDRENMIRVVFYAPVPRYEFFKKLLQREGISESEFHRSVWLAGLGAISERCNKIEVQDNLMRKSDK